MHTARALLHEVPSVLTNSESDLTPFSGNAGTKIWCTVSAFKIALGNCRPALNFKLINGKKIIILLNLTMDLHQMTEKLEIIPHAGV